MCKEIVQERPPFDVAWQIIDGLKVRYATGGSGGERVMLLSPWPESIFAFAPVWVGLAKQFNVLAIDASRLRAAGSARCSLRAAEDGGRAIGSTNRFTLLYVPVARQRESNPARIEAHERRPQMVVTRVGADRELRHARKGHLGAGEDTPAERAGGLSGVQIDQVRP